MRNTPANLNAHFTDARDYNQWLSLSPYWVASLCIECMLAYDNVSRDCMVTGRRRNLWHLYTAVI